MEYLQIFDENGNKINDKISRDKKREISNGKYYMIVLLFIENYKGNFLIQHTSKEKGSVYAVTGGHVSFGDDALKTVIKEAKEELNLTITKEELECVGVIKGKAVLANVFYIKKNIDLSKLLLQSSEVESVCWMSTKDIEKLIEKNEFRNTNILAYNLLMEYKKNY